jgi:drug/metabolite transporter superfamily protein YnfA
MLRSFIAALYGATLLAFGIVAGLPLSGAAATLTSFLALSFAGIVFLRRLAPAIDSWIDVLLWGSILGLLSGRLCLVLTSLLIGPSFFSAAAALVLVVVASICVSVFRPVKPMSWSGDDSRELAAILGLSSAVLVAMTVSYWGVGHLSSKGYAFVPNFGWDLLNHIACSAELAKQLPPQNPYFAGQTLHYYWFYHLWPAAVMNLSHVTARDAVILTLPPTALLFVGALTCLARSYIPRVVPRFLGIGLGLFAFSYIGVFFIVRMTAARFFESLSRIVNTDYSFLSHSWFRDFLYEPHAVTSLTCFAFLLYLDKIPKTEARLRQALLAGLILGAVTITDLFVGVIGLLWLALTSFRPFIRDCGSRFPILLELLVACAGIVGAFALGLFPARSGALHLALHPMTKYAPLYLLIEMGPIFVFGLTGIYLALRRDRTGSSTSLLLVLAISLLIAFTVVHGLVPNQVIRKSIKVVQFPLVIFAAVAWSAFLDLPRRHWLRLTGAVVALAGLSTIFTDLVQYVDIEADRSPPTAYISEDKMQALTWIREHTASDAIIQQLDEVRPGRKIRDNSDMSLPSLAERRTLFGNHEFVYVFQIPEADRESRKTILEQIFTATTPADLELCLDRLPPFFLLVVGSAPGPHVALRQLEERGVLEPVFRAGEVSVLSKRRIRL